MTAAVAIAETWGEYGTLWAIRFALLLMFVAYVQQLRGASEVATHVRILWLAGAICVLLHSVGALISFHHGSHEAAFNSTAKQTEELLGIAVGAGLYVNYGFALVWMGDALFRIAKPVQYLTLPNRYRSLVHGFLLFIAFNGTVVFKDGWIRWLGLTAGAFLVWLGLLRYLGSKASNGG